MPFRSTVHLHERKIHTDTKSRYIFYLILQTFIFFAAAEVAVTFITMTIKTIKSNYDNYSDVWGIKSIENSEYLYNLSAINHNIREKFCLFFMRAFLL